MTGSAPHEGFEAKNRLRSTGIKMNDVAIKLGMTRQNMNYHFAKRKIEDYFLQNLKNVFPTVFPNDKSENSDKNGTVKTPTGTRENTDSDTPLKHLSKPYPTTAPKNRELGERSPKLEADPLYLAADPNDPDNDGSRFEDLGDGQFRMRVALVHAAAYAGYLRGYQDNEFYDELDMVSFEVPKKPRGHYLAFEVKGDSMIPTDFSDTEYMALPGWIAIAREVQKHHWYYKLHINNGKPWIIVHKTEGILIKKIIDHDVDNGKITIHSLNPKYKDEELYLNDIEQLFSVIKCIVE